MLTLKQFRETRKAEDYGYSYRFGYFLIEDFYGNWSTGCEDFEDFDKAEEQLYQMYCDEDRLTDGY